MVVSTEQEARNTLWGLIHATTMNIDEIRDGFNNAFPLFIDRFDEWFSEFVD